MCVSVRVCLFVFMSVFLIRILVAACVVSHCMRVSMCVCVWVGVRVYASVCTCAYVGACVSLCVGERISHMK